MAHSRSSGPIEKLVRKDQWIVAGAALVILAIAAWYTSAGVGMNMTALEMTRMAGPIGEPMNMGPQPNWTLSYTILMFFMWWLMMIAMMIPSASPMILLYTALKRAGSKSERVVFLSLVFLGGYLAMWAAFSLAAVAVQWLAETIALSDGLMMTIQSRTFAAVVLIAAGLYQYTLLKEACLKRCRSPAHFLAAHNWPGTWGAFRTGCHHGAFCLGCCWALMMLLFVGGIMNLYWIVGLAIYVLVEKIVPHGIQFARTTGAALILFGGYLLLS